MPESQHLTIFPASSFRTLSRQEVWLLQHIAGLGCASGEREARENLRRDLANKGLACGEVAFFIRKYLCRYKLTWL